MSLKNARAQAHTSHNSQDSAVQVGTSTFNYTYSPPVSRIRKVRCCTGYLSARAPYEFEIHFSAYRDMSGRQYIDLLRRLFRSVNLQLKRNAGVSTLDDMFGIGKIEMLNGFVLIKAHEPRPQVELRISVNPHYQVSLPDLEQAFLSTKCYESKANPVPIFDDLSLREVTHTSLRWQCLYQERDWHLLSLNGGSLKWDH